MIREVTQSQEDKLKLAAFISSLSDKTTSLWNPYGLHPQEKAERIAEELQRRQDLRQFSLVALEEGQIVGLAYIRYMPDIKPFLRDKVSEGIVVSDRFQGKGVGSQLMEALIRKARSMGIRKIWASTYLDNIRSRKFHEKHGFVVEGVFFDDENWDLTDCRYFKGKRSVLSMALFLDTKDKERFESDKRDFYGSLLSNNKAMDE